MNKLEGGNVPNGGEGQEKSPNRKERVTSISEIDRQKKLREVVEDFIERKISKKQLDRIYDEEILGIRHQEEETEQPIIAK